MRVGVPTEIKDNEFRVAITPAGVHALTRRGHTVTVQSGAGVGAAIPDDDYIAAGAAITDDVPALWADSEMVLKVKEPIAEEYSFLRPDLLLFTYLHLAADRPLTEELIAKRVTSIAYETVATASGALPLLAPMSAIAGRLAAQRDTLRRTDERLAHSDRRLQRLDAKAAAIHSVAGSLTLALVLLGVGLLVEQGQIDTPEAALALLIALTAMEPFAALRRGALESGRAWLAARRLSPHCTPTVQPPGPRPDAGCAIIVDDVSVRHPDSPVDALTALSLRLAAGERVAVVGPSGAGKSTLMALIAGERHPHTGRVLTQPGAWLNQRPDLFQDSLRDNLRLADPDADDAALWQALEAAGLADAIRRLQAGLDTRLGEGGLGLSAGQARRLALARLLLQKRPLWLLDEPTEGLDAATAADVLARLDTLGQGRAWLMAAHLRREAALADRLLVLRNGRLEDEFRRGSEGFEAALAALRPD